MHRLIPLAQGRALCPALHLSERHALCPPLYRCLSSSPALRIVTALKPKDTPTLGDPTNVKLARIHFPPFVKDMFAGEFNKSILSYAEVLDYERYYALEEQTSQLVELLSRKRELVEAINQRGQARAPIIAHDRKQSVACIWYTRYSTVSLSNHEVP